jgi:hypothetical protein
MAKIEPNSLVRPLTISDMMMTETRRSSDLEAALAIAERYKICTLTTHVIG